MTAFTWNRYGGYEVSSRGDPRFSPFYALMPDGRSIEAHYQCDVKGHAPGSSDWMPHKGKKPLNPQIDLRDAYLALWEVWAERHPALMTELRRRANLAGGVLADRFARTPVNQAWALATILNCGTSAERVPDTD